jgi:two-component system sensor histidine kinase PhoQ
MKSLGSRLIATLCVLLVLCFGLTLAWLDLAFRDLAERSRRDVLEAHVVALIAAAEYDSEGKLAPAGPLGEPRLERPGSGLMAEIRPRFGKPTWRSASSVGRTAAFDGDLKPGERRTLKLTASDGTRLLAFELGVQWELRRGRTKDYVFIAAESLEPYYAQLARFRVQLLGGFAAFTAVLLLGVIASLRHVLRPLRRIEEQIAGIEGGDREQLEGDWPRELEGVAANLNALLRAERDRLRRYRNMLGNLAHSLKTPLSVLRALAAQEPVDRPAVTAQLDRMQDIVQHQLDRAAATGAGVGVAAVPLAPMLDDLAGALRKVYAGRDLAIEVAADPELRFPMDRGDCLELAGNLADNACKWARARVRVSAQPWREPGWRRPGLELSVEDDGPGIRAEDRARVVGRGVRLDERVPGQGLGLAMVHDVVAAYGGTFELGESALGGLAATVRLPGA